MDYKDEIYKMLECIHDEKLLIKIYTFVMAWIKKEDTSNEEMPPPLKKE